jgi:hypothetical protein
MKVRTLLVIIFMALVAAFVALNWSAFVQPTALTLGFTMVEAPLGLLLLGLAVVIVVPLLIYAAYLQRTLLRTAARNAEKLEAQRHLAENAEASRYTKLREYMEEDSRKTAERDAQIQGEISELSHRLDEFEKNGRAAVAHHELDTVEHG